MQTRKKILLGAVLIIVAGLGMTVAEAASQLSLLPSGVGNYNQFTTVGTSTHYLNVDEATCNGLTDYNQTSTVGNRDAYAVSLAGIPDGAKITSIAISPCAGRAVTGGTNPVMNVFYRWNGANSADAGAYAISLATPASLATTTYGVALTKNATSTLEIGAVLTSGTKGIRLSREAVVVSYETLPADPTALSASVSTSTASTVNLSWSDNASNETGYLVERGTDGINFTQIGSTTANKTTYADVGRTAGLYYYRVRATNTAGNSNYTNVASVTVSVPTSPTNLSVTSSTVGTSSSAVLLWTDNATNEANYVVEFSTSTGAGPFVLRATIATNLTTYTDFFVTSGQTIFYRVKATNAVGSSGYTNVATTTIP